MLLIPIYVSGVSLYNKVSEYSVGCCCGTITHISMWQLALNLLSMNHGARGIDSHFQSTVHSVVSFHTFPFHISCCGWFRIEVSKNLWMWHLNHWNCWCLLASTTTEVSDYHSTWKRNQSLVTIFGKYFCTWKFVKICDCVSRDLKYESKLYMYSQLLNSEE